MSKGNKEIRFRASDHIHLILDRLADQLGAPEKSLGAKLLINLGDERIKEVVNYVDNITHPLNNRQFEDFFLALKIRVKQKRESRSNIKKR